jgi:serine/threonine protein kinase
MDLEVTGLERFELRGTIAQSANGRTYEGLDRKDRSLRCAIKVIDPNVADGARFETILNAEAPGAVTFRHENAVRTVFAGKNGGHTIIVTERMPGHTLDELIQRASAESKPFPWELVAWIAYQVAEVLRVAHQTPWADGESKGMFHCSISPHSIFLLPDGGVRLLGIGLGRSRICLPASPAKLAYRAPELFERQKPDELTDIYSLGVTLYDAISMQRVFHRGSEGEMLEAILSESPPSLRVAQPGVTAPIDELIASMMSKFPRTRPTLRKVTETFETLSRRSGFSQKALAEALTEVFGASNNGRKKAQVPVERSTTGDFYPEYDIDDLVDKLIASKKTEAEPLPPPLPADALLEVNENPFDVDAVVNAIVSSSKSGDLPKTPPPRTPPVRIATPPPRRVQPNDEQLKAGALSSLEEGESFDVDALVNAIVTSGKKTPRPDPDERVDTMPAESPPRGIVVKPPLAKTPPQAFDDEPPTPRDGTPSPAELWNDARADVTSLKPGDLIGDRYRVIDELGEGGMSVVYRVQHMLLLKYMALKLLRPELSQMPAVVERFQLEARSVCQLDDPNIVRVTDFGRQPNGSLYLVMDYLEGEPLAWKLRREGTVSIDTAVDITSQILSGLAHAHGFGVVHRDLKPENIMLVKRFDRLQVKILDFGIAKLTAREDEGSARPITQAGTVFGTPRYMSPEQASAEAVDLRADLYAVGVILYEMLSGKPPFDGPSAVKILSKVLTEEPPKLNLTQPSKAVGQQVEQVVMRALQKERADRYPTADAFRAALVKAAGK